MNHFFQVVIIGIAIAFILFWIWVTFRVFDPRDRFWWWIKLVVPQGIMIAWALRIVSLIAIKLFL